jgi:hypothetical protein
MELIMKKINREQITDHRGNSFVPNVIQNKLYKAGWRLAERKKVGCVWIVRWYDLSNPIRTYNQQDALDILTGKIQF